MQKITLDLRPTKRITIPKLGNKVPLKIDDRTTIFISPDKDPDEARRNYFKQRELNTIKQRH